jgi:hypothetical protein
MTTTTTNFKNVLKRALVMATLFSLFTVSLFAQKNKGLHYALNADLLTSGNGHGTYMGLGAEIRNYRNAYSIMPLLQKSSARINALQFTYSRLLTGVTPRNTEDMDGSELMGFELRLFTSACYYHGAGLTQATINMERTEEENYMHLKNLRLETAQLNVGFGGNFKLNPVVMVRTYISLGYYYHTNLTQMLYHEKGAPVLNLGIGLGLLK